MIEKLTEIIIKHTGNQSLKIDESSNLIKDLGLTSFDLIQLACAVEDEFDIEIPDRAIKSLKTVGDVIDFIENA